MTMTEHEPTQAAEPLTEPAPTEDETQSIHAWARADDDTEVSEASERRSWKLPVTLVTLAAAAAITAGMVTMWPHHASPQVKAISAAPAAPAAPVKVADPPAPHKPSPPPADPDERFAWLLKQQGFDVPDATVASLTGAAHKVCTDLGHGRTYDQAVNDLVRGSAVTHDEATIFIDTTMHQFCPQFFAH